MTYKKRKITSKLNKDNAASLFLDGVTKAELKWCHSSNQTGVAVISSGVSTGPDSDALFSKALTHIYNDVASRFHNKVVCEKEKCIQRSSKMSGSIYLETLGSLLSSLPFSSFCCRAALPCWLFENYFDPLSDSRLFFLYAVLVCMFSHTEAVVCSQGCQAAGRIKSLANVACGSLKLHFNWCGG